MADDSPDKKSGCVAMIYSGLFRQRCLWPRRSASTSSIHTHGNNGIHSINSKRRRGSDERAFLDDINLNEYPQRNDESPMMNVATKTPPPLYQEKGIKISNAPVASSKVGLSNNHQQSNGLVRASSSNVMLFGNLGNLRQPAGYGTSNPWVSNSSVLDYSSEMGLISNGNYGNAYGTNGGNGNYNAYNNNENVKISRNNVKEKDNDEPEEEVGPLCRALSTRLDPETLKAMGNEEYKQGNFAEALAFYGRAIGLDPDMASYRSNETVFECREAIKIDPTYRRAHHRLATLSDPNDIAKAKNLQIYLSKCTEARKLRDWQTVIKETSSSISSGADSALQVFALKAESLLKLHKHEDADTELSKAPKFGIDDCTKFFGPVGNANLLVIRAQVDVALGRFEEAVATAQRAAQLDSTNKDVNSTLRKAQTLATSPGRILRCRCKMLG
ncbi:hypothetical protein MKX01_037098 [Papaver californicum]|nr:hypothetical protein MKX01_037098 [Papaver californicum]